MVGTLYITFIGQNNSIKLLQIEDFFLCIALYLMDNNLSFDMITEKTRPVNLVCLMKLCHANGESMTRDVLCSATIKLRVVKFTSIRMRICARRTFAR